MLKAEIALSLAKRLTVVRNFPRFEEAIEAVAEDLILLTENCPDPDIAESRARWLVTAIRRTWSEWGGADQMVSKYKERFDPPAKPGNAAVQYEKIPIECKICNDTGVFRPGGRESWEPYQWCECQMGIHLHFCQPDLLERLYNRPVFGPAPVEPVLSSEQLHVRAEVEAKIKPAPDCPGCVNPPHTVAQYWEHHAKDAAA